MPRKRYKPEEIVAKLICWRRREPAWLTRSARSASPNCGLSISFMYKTDIKKYTGPRTKTSRALRTRLRFV